MKLHSRKLDERVLSFRILTALLVFAAPLVVQAQPNDRPPPPPREMNGGEGGEGGEGGRPPGMLPGGGGDTELGGREGGFGSGNGMRFRMQLMRRLVSPEMVMQHQAELNLSSDQKRQLLEETKKLYSAMPEYQMKLGEAQEKLSKQLEEKKVNEEAVLKSMDEMGNVERDMKRSHLSAMIRLHNMLNDEQLEKLKSLRAEAFEKGGFGGRGMGAGFREKRREFRHEMRDRISDRLPRDESRTSGDQE